LYPEYFQQKEHEPEQQREDEIKPFFDAQAPRFPEETRERPGKILQEKEEFPIEL